MVSVWIALGGYVATLAGALGAVLLAQRNENRRWLATQIHLADVARADRLRSVYGEMAQAALVLRLVVGQTGFLLNDETVTQRDKRHDEQIREALGRVGEVGGLILVESSAEPIRDTYSLIASLTDEYMRMDRHEPAGEGRTKKLNDLAEAISAKTDELIQKASDHLTELETPAPIERERPHRSDLATRRKSSSLSSGPVLREPNGPPTRSKAI